MEPVNNIINSNKYELLKYKRSIFREVFLDEDINNTINVKNNVMTITGSDTFKW